MLCERCKIREASIKYTEIVNGVKTEHNLCTQCAKEMDFGPYSAIFDGEFPLGKLLSGLLGLEEGDSRGESRSKVVCPTCGTTYEEFVEASRFGCQDCYGVFDVLISENMKQLQGSDIHTGKRPKYQKSGVEADMAGSGQIGLPAQSMEEQLMLLNAKLKEAVRQEEYELAAKYRDQIKAIREGKDNCG